MASRPALAAGALLRLMRLASPSLPVGGFSYSEGLEAAVEAGSVRDAESARRWLLDQLELVLARADLAVVPDAIDAWDRGDLGRIVALNHWISATRETAELRLQTEQMGRSMAEWLLQQESGGAGSVHTGVSTDTSTGTGTGTRIGIGIGTRTDTDPPPDPRVAHLKSLAPAPTWPIAFALAVSAAGAPRHESMLAFAFGWAENMVQATLKAVPLGQSAAQRVLAALIDAIPAAVDRAAALAPDERQAYTPMLAILSAQHESQYSRLFRS